MAGNTALPGPRTGPWTSPSSHGPGTHRGPVVPDVEGDRVSGIAELPGGRGLISVLIVNADPAVSGLLADQLKTNSLPVSVAADAVGGLAAVGAASFDVVIVDRALPDRSGLCVLVELRRIGSTSHVIVLGADSTELDRVRVFDMGADDYVVEPFYVRELTARVLAVRRRFDREKEAILRFGRLELDLRARRATVAATELELPAREFDLLAFLASRPGRVFSRVELLRSVWRSAADWQQPSTVTEHVRRLRSKIEQDPAHPQFLVTVRGTGYRFDRPASTPS